MTVSPRLWRGLPPALPLLLVTVVLAVSLFPVDGQECLPSQQPNISQINPPSGNPRTVYTILGVNLNEVANIVVQQEDAIISTNFSNASSSNDSITFRLMTFSIEDGLATVTLVPTVGNCSNVSVDLNLLRRGKLHLKIERSKYLDTTYYNYSQSKKSFDHALNT